MAVTYGFYDSLNHDRLYNAQQMSAIFDGIINDGVFMSVGNQFHTVAGTGMQVIVKSGRAWFDSTWTLNDAEYPLSIDAADVLLTRIDAVVLEVNSEVATRANTIKVVKGTPASTPAKPTLTNTATIHQHALAYVTVAKNITAITNSMIEIVVGKTETPYVTAILETTDITDLFKKWENDFQTWFETVKGTLDGDVALNLQNQITTLERNILKDDTKTSMGLPSTAIGDDAFKILANRFNNYRCIIFDESSNITIEDDILNNTAFAICIGGGGAGGSPIQTSSGTTITDSRSAGGGGGGYVTMSTIQIKKNKRYAIVVGAGGDSYVSDVSDEQLANSGGESYILDISTQTKIISAAGGGGGGHAINTSSGAGGIGSSGGGGGGCALYRSSSGGNGSVYGGGGGGGLTSSPGSYYYYAANGGNGGKYGGGGGAGGLSYRTTAYQTDPGIGGTSSGFGGKGGNGGAYRTNDGALVTSAEDGDDGTKHLCGGMGYAIIPDLIFKEVYNSHGGTVSTTNRMGSGGGGGGGYGGNGGTPQYYNGSAGAGGGGYHSNGGDGETYGGGGGGGYGGNGGNGHYGGGGGGGFFANGGDGGSTSNNGYAEDGESPGAGGGGGYRSGNKSSSGGDGGNGRVYLCYYVGGRSDAF